MKSNIKAAASLPDVAKPSSNAERLGQHLKEDGLAKALLDAWLSGPKTDAQKRMLEAINNFEEPSD